MTMMNESACRRPKKCITAMGKSIKMILCDTSDKNDTLTTPLLYDFFFVNGCIFHSNFPHINDNRVTRHTMAKFGRKRGVPSLYATDFIVVQCTAVMLKAIECRTIGKQLCITGVKKYLYLILIEMIINKRSIY